ncbi:MAG: hypothetical protein PVH29_01500 [Candidatus Zixiibacteriota bacterium]|jgi:hypothetical protein
MKICDLVGAAFLLLGTVGAVLSWGAFGDVISSFEMPPETNCCEGLAWDGDYLWSCGSPTDAFVSLTTEGSVVSLFGIGPTYNYAEGAAWDGMYLWYSYHVPGYDRASVNRVTTTGSAVGGFEAYTFNIAGLAWENDGIWCNNTKYTTTGSIISTFFIFGGVRDMAWDGHYLWSGNKQITTNGSFIQSFPVPGVGYPTGTTFDGNYLWIHVYPRAYQIDIGVVGVDPASMGKIKSLYR